MSNKNIYMPVFLCFEQFEQESIWWFCIIFQWFHNLYWQNNTMHTKKWLDFKGTWKFLRCYCFLALFDKNMLHKALEESINIFFFRFMRPENINMCVSLILCLCVCVCVCKLCIMTDIQDLFLRFRCLLLRCFKEFFLHSFCFLK